jgi:hypothetical protein
MAQKRTASPPAEARVFEAVQPFSWRGTAVPAGSTVVAGHPMLEGREVLFRPFRPTFGQLPEPAPDPDDAGDDAGDQGGQA